MERRGSCRSSRIVPTVTSMRPSSFEKPRELKRVTRDDDDDAKGVGAPFVILKGWPVLLIQVLRVLSHHQQTRTGLFFSLAHLQQNMCHSCLNLYIFMMNQNVCHFCSVLYIFNRLCATLVQPCTFSTHWDGMADILILRPLQSWGSAKLWKSQKRLAWKLWWKGSQLNVDGWIWGGQWKPWNMARSSLWKGTRLGWTITQAAIEARDESKAKSVDHSTPDRQYWTSRWLIIPEKTPGGNKKKSLGVKMAAFVSLFQSALLPLFFLFSSTTSKVQWSCNQCRVRTL